MTLSEIKDQYAIELGYEDFSAFINQFEGSADEFVKAIEPVFIEYVTACCKATQEKCAESAVIGEYKTPSGDMVLLVSEIPILSPNNIVLL